MEKIVTRSEEETFSLAKQFAARLQAGDAVLLSGDLGVGKTIFTKGVCEALGVREIVNSPTFTIVNEYLAANGLSVYHFDMYRIEEEDELIEIGFDDYLNAEAVCLIEWPEKTPSFLPKRHYAVSISRTEEQGEDARIITIEEPIVCCC